MTAKENSKKRKKKIRVNYRKASRALAVLVLVLTVLMSYIPAALGTGTGYDRSLIRECGDPGVDAPLIKASSAIMYSIDLDKAVYEKNADERMEPYSITKLLTCYLALENLDPEKMVTISKNATKELEDGMEMELEPGEEVKTIDLIYASMMMSANDAAIALGEEVSGSEKEFAKLMNKTVKDWGCKNTHFVNPNGWADDDHYTTARDMAIITKHCLENEKLREISLTKKYTVPATNKSGELKMENALLKVLDDYEVVTGGKTGSWSQSQCTIALEFKDNGLSAVIVLLGDTAKGRAEDPKTLVEFCHDVTPGFIVTKSDKNVCEAWVKHGAEVKVPCYVKGLRYAYPKNGKASGVKVKTKFDKLEAPVKKGDKVGTYEIIANKEVVGKGNLYAGKDVKKGWFPSNLYISNRGTIALVLAVVLILLLGSVLEKLKTINKGKKLA